MHVVTSAGEINQYFNQNNRFFYYGIITNMSFLKSLKMEAVVSEMKRQLEDGDLKLDQKISLLNDGINSETVFYFTRFFRLPLAVSKSVALWSK